MYINPFTLFYRSVKNGMVDKALLNYHYIPGHISVDDTWTPCYKQILRAKVFKIWSLNNLHKEKTWRIFFRNKIKSVNKWINKLTARLELATLSSKKHAVVLHRYRTVAAGWTEAWHRVSQQDMTSHNNEGWEISQTLRSSNESSKETLSSQAKACLTWWQCFHLRCHGYKDGSKIS